MDSEEPLRRKVKDSPNCTSNSSTVCRGITLLEKVFLCHKTLNIFSEGQSTTAKLAPVISSAMISLRVMTVPFSSDGALSAYKSASIAPIYSKRICFGRIKLSSNVRCLANIATHIIRWRWELFQKGHPGSMVLFERIKVATRIRGGWRQ